MASGPRLSPPALIPMRTFTGASRCVAERGDGARDAGVVDVVVRDEADRLGRDGVGQHAVTLQVGQQLVRLGVGEGHDVGAHPSRVEAAVGPALRHRLGQPRRPGVVLGQALDHVGAAPPAPAPPGRRPGACRRRAACAPDGPRRSRPPSPASSEPTGAHRPLDRQHMTVVAGGGPLRRRARPWRPRR